MSYTNYLTSILIITTVYHLINIPIAFSNHDTLIGYSCLLSEPPTITFNGNLESVMYDLTNNTSLRGGYYSTSYGSSFDDQAYGHAMCRGDLSTDECNTCVQKAADSAHCNGARSGTIWREDCMVKYSDVDFLGTIDTNAFYLSDDDLHYWTNSSSIDATKSLMVSLKDIIDSNMYYASGMAYVEENGITLTLKGMVQCTRDFSNIGDCKKCLERVININLNTKKRGGGTVCGSCYARFWTDD